MVEQQDSFWKLFFTGIAGVLLLAVLIIFIILLQPYTPLPKLPHDDSSDPYAYAHGPELTATSTYLYRESIPLGYHDTSWGAVVDWRSKQKHFEGLYAVRAEFKTEWGGLSLVGRGIPNNTYHAISLNIFAESGVTDLYLEIYNAAGTAIGRQSIGWYFPTSTLQTGHWQQVTIPLANFGSMPATIGGFAIISEHMGVIYIDDVHVTQDTSAHTIWIPSIDSASTSMSLLDLYERMAQVKLPYQMNLEPQSLINWHTPTSQLSIEKDGIKAGPPLNGGSTDATFLGGKLWTDYRIETKVLWGPAASFSLVARIRDENSQASCGYSQFAGVVQIYVMQEGISNLIAESAYVEDIPSTNEWAQVPLAMEVKGNRINCYAYNRLAVSAFSSTMPTSGSAGIAVWDPAPNKLPHVLKFFSVSPL